MPPLITKNLHEQTVIRQAIQQFRRGQMDWS
jgi:hypothetical protein